MNEKLDTNKPEKGWYTPTMEDSAAVYASFFPGSPEDSTATGLPQVSEAPATSETLQNAPESSELAAVIPINSPEQKVNPTLNDIADKLRSAPRYVRRGDISLRDADTGEDLAANQSYGDTEAIPINEDVIITDSDGQEQRMSREEYEYKQWQQEQTEFTDKEISPLAPRVQAMKNPFGDMMIERSAGVPNEFCPADAEIMVEIDPNNPNGFNPDSIKIISAGTIASSFEPIDRENSGKDHDPNPENEPSVQNTPEQPTQEHETLNKSA